MRKPFFFLISACAVASAQVTLEGEAVRAATGGPLAAVRVIAQCGDGQLRGATDAAGHFRFTGIPAAGCSLLLEGPGLLPRRQPVTIGPQDTAVTLRIPMRPQAVISGKVLDENGWPMAQVLVTAAEYGTTTGTRQLEAVRRVQTDDLGAYRLTRLPPGRYYLRVRPPAGDYLAAWYPGAAGFADARAIDLAEGEEASGMNLHLAPGPGAEVRGRITSPEGMRPFLQVWWEDLGMSSMVSPAPVAPDGSFTLRHLAPGRYLLEASARSIVDNSVLPVSATEDIEVGSDNIEGITLQMAVRELEGTISSGGAVLPDNVSVILFRTGSNAHFSAKVRPDGSFVIAGVSPGRYTADASADRAVAESVRFGGQEILGRSFDVDGTAAPLRVRFREWDRFVSLRGTITDASQAAVAGARVIFVHAGAEYPVGAIKPFAETDQNGAIEGPELPPGTYRVYVIRDPLETGQLMDSAVFLRRQEQWIPPLQVSAGGNPPLRVIVP
jgi:Carboxypeptidase regulatory-like domain